LCLRLVSSFSFTPSSSRTHPNTASNAGRNATVVPESPFALRQKQRARNADWRLPFPSRQGKADPYFAAHVFRNRQRQADPNRHQLAPCISLTYDFGHHNSSVGFVMQERKRFVVTCKDCQRAISTGAKEFPFHSIEVTCPLCGEKHRYLPSQVILGKPNELAAKKQRA